MKASTLAPRPDARAAAAADSRRALGRPDARRPAAGVSHDAAVAPHRRQGNPAQEPEPDLLPDQRRRPRSGAHRGGHAPARRLRLVLSVLPRSRAVPHARHDPARDAARRGRREGRSELRRPPDAVALGPQGAQHPVAGQPHRHAVPAGGRRRRSRHDLRARHRHRRSRRITSTPTKSTYMSIGEGATSEGEFWESLNTACTRNVPVLYLVEDNGYAISVPVEVQTPGGDMSRLVESFPNLEVWRCDGTDFLDSYRTIGEAVAWIRRERKPAFVHAKVIRPYSHSLSDDERLYKTPDEREAEAQRDPLTKMRAFLLSEKIATEAELDDDRGVGRSRDRRVDRPGAQGAEAVGGHRRLVRVLAGRGSVVCGLRHGTAGRGQARHDGRGDQPHAEGRDGAQPAHRRSSAKTWPTPARRRRCRTCPARAACSRSRTACRRPTAPSACSTRRSPKPTSSAAPSAWRRAALKPVVEIQFFDYIWPAMMQFKDEMSMLRYRSGNNWSCPMVVRVPIGGYLRGGAPYHSQSGVSIFAHCPGIRIVFPSNAVDAAGLLRTAIRCDDPVLYLEHKHLYRQTYNKGAYPGHGLHDPVRQGLAAPRRHRHGGADVGRAGAALAARGTAGGERRRQRRGVRPAHDHAVRLGGHRRRSSGKRTA